MKTEVYNIEGMHCAACSSAIERVTRKLNGVETSEVNLPMNRMTIVYDEAVVTEEMICNKIKKAGFSAHLRTETEEPKQVDTSEALRNEKMTLIASIALSAILMYISMGQMWFANLPIPEIFSMNAHPVNFAIIQLFITMVVIFLEKRFFISGFTSLFHGNPNMDTLVAISASTSFIYSFVMTLFIDTKPHAVHGLYYESAAMVLALVSVGKYMEGKNKDKTKGAIEKLMQLTPDTAILVDDNGQWEVPTDKLQVGDVVLVQAGKSVPLDGVVIKGSGSINEAMLTGESLPVEKQEKSEVIGGSISVSGALYVQVTRKGEDTTLAKIVRFVEDAQGKKAPISKLADRVAGVFVPVVIGIASVSAIIWLVLGSELSFALKIFTSILVIACPCSLGLATPTSIIVGTGLGASNGILIRSGEALENTHKVNVAIFDKTGTITCGTPTVTDVASKTMSEDEFLSLVISVEKLSSHPLAKAICEEETNRNLSIDAFDGTFENLDGLGIVATLESGQSLAIGNRRLMEQVGANISAEETDALSDAGKTVMYAAIEDTLIGYIAVVDQVKDTAKEAIATLRKMNIKTIMLTGDNAHTANCIAKEVGVDEVIAEVLPTDKAAVVQKYQDANHTVMMVGDGINDAPALAQANIGCAVGGGSDIAIESAQIILMKDNLMDVPKAINLSRKTMENIKQNLFWAFCYNCLCIPVAAGVLFVPFGILLSPMIGGFAMSMSSLFVVGNALRLKGKKI
ncbi:heavy metal translocating P-type ATPase [Chakrabartyella piscis]|uniref:heavy metal translocating P-type ATPase n=1 Tax=Chakrabartyella piscis TaxID=2918914 RepID=UPI00295837A1|nr:heavy metal translocating P-type ATPase [Chakrabartyella piscis]